MNAAGDGFEQFEDSAGDLYRGTAHAIFCPKFRLTMWRLEEVAANHTP